MSRYGMPGPGGSLGQCALCGENFLKEIILGSTVKSFTVGSNLHAQDLYGHDECLEKYTGKDFTDLPEKSPLRQAYEKQKAA